MPDPDLTLLDQWIAGNADAGNRLFKQYFTPLYRFFVHKTDGEIDDLVQETFIACLRGRDTFQRQSSFRTYLFAIARHVLLAYWRKRARPHHIPVDEVSIASLSTTVGTRLAGEEDRARLLEALRNLPMDQQMLLEMYYWQDLDRERLAEIFDVETATIGSRLFRARKQLIATLATAAPATEEALDAWARSLSG
jgi:RNA polymerase sigma-70 factor (ECF subfamily)